VPTLSMSRVTDDFEVIGMSTISPLNTALFALQQSLRSFEETASRIAETGPGDDLPRDLVALRQAEIEIAANVTVARTANEIAGSLLDLLA